jgi:hypothetical protein
MRLHGQPIFDDCDCGSAHVELTDGQGGRAWLRRHARDLLWSDEPRRKAADRFANDQDDRRADDDRSDWDERIRHRNWRQHTKSLPLDEHAYRAYRRRLRAIRWTELRGRESTPDKIRKLPAYRFDAAALTEEGRARWVAERQLDRWLGDPCRESDAISSTYRRSEADERGAARRIAAHKASTLLKRGRAMERAEADASAYAEHGTELRAHQVAERPAKTQRAAIAPAAANVLIRQRDAQQLVDTINTAAQQLEPTVFILLQSVLYVSRNFTDDVHRALNGTRTADGKYKTTIGDLLSLGSRCHGGNAEDGVRGLMPLEWSLSWVAPLVGLQAASLRELLAIHAFPVFREPLRPWASSRDGGWSVAASKQPIIAPASFRAVSWLAGNRTTGRPRAHNPALVIWALFFAEQLAEMLHPADALLTISGDANEPFPAVADRVHRAAGLVARTIQADDRVPPPDLPSAATVADILGSARLGRRSAVQDVCYAVAAHAYGLPRAALDALVKASRKEEVSRIGKEGRR